MLNICSAEFTKIEFVLFRSRHGSPSATNVVVVVVVVAVVVLVLVVVVINIKASSFHNRWSSNFAYT